MPCDLILRGQCDGDDPEHDLDGKQSTRELEEHRELRSAARRARARPRHRRRDTECLCLHWPSRRVLHWGRSEEPAGQKEFEALPRRLHVSADETGGRRFEVADCDLRHRSPWPPQRPLRPYGAGPGHALLRPAKQGGHRRQHRKHFGRLSKCRVANSHAAIEKRLERIERGMGEHDEQLQQIIGGLRRAIRPARRLSRTLPAPPIQSGLSWKSASACCRPGAIRGRNP